MNIFYYFHIIYYRPKRYKLSDLVDWINKSIRHNANEYGYRRIDLKNAPLFQLKVALTEALSPAYPIGNLHWEGLEKVFSIELYHISLTKLSRIKWFHF